MNKKFEYHREYPEAVYKDRVYRWFNDNTSTMCDADVQKFVNDAMHGNLTFKCADEIDIDDPDISMIDNLLMDIASEKNDELINTYTDEIDWDNYYIENYNKGGNMDKKLESRIDKLERLLKVNEVHDRDELGLKAMNAVEALSKASDLVSQIAIALEYDDNPQMKEWRSIEDKLDDMIVKVNKLGFKL